MATRVPPQLSLINRAIEQSKLDDEQQRTPASFDDINPETLDVLSDGGDKLDNYLNDVTGKNMSTEEDDFLPIEPRMSEMDKEQYRKLINGITNKPESSQINTPPIENLKMDQQTSEKKSNVLKQNNEDPYKRLERMMQVGAIGDALSKIFTAGLAQDSATPLANIDTNAFKTLSEIGKTGVQKFESDRDQKLRSDLIKSRLSGQNREPSFEEKERIKAQIKDDVSQEKEKRETKKEAKNALSALDSQEKYIDEALKLLKEGGSTGPIDQFIGKITPKGQKLQKAINNISLDKMVKMFAGMSKAIDSDAERAFFQSTQPSMSDYESVNKDTLTKLKEHIKNLREKTKQVALTGEQQISESTKKSPYGEFIEKNGKKYRWNPEVKKYRLAE